MPGLRQRRHDIGPALFRGDQAFEDLPDRPERLTVVDVRRIQALWIRRRAEDQGGVAAAAAGLRASTAVRLAFNIDSASTSRRTGTLSSRARPGLWSAGVIASRPRYPIGTACLNVAIALSPPLVRSYDSAEERSVLGPARILA